MFKREKMIDLRIEKNISRQWLAKQLRVSERLVHKWECGEEEPTQTQIKCIAAVLNVSAYSLVDDIKVIDGEVRAFKPVE